MDINMKFDEHLLLCIRQGDNTEAQTILQEVNVCKMADNSGTTLLHVTADCGNSTVAEYLIGRGCNVDAVNNRGNTPLIIASQRSHADVINLLIEKNASVLMPNDQGENAAQILLGGGEEGREVWDKCLKKVKDECSNNSLKTAKELFKVRCPLPRAVRLKEAAITRYMLENGCSINEPDTAHFDYTALHQAVIFDDLENVKLLVNSGADVNAVDRSGRVPLSLSSDRTEASEEILKILLDQGARLIDDNGALLVGQIFQFGKKHTVMKLLERYNMSLAAKTVEQDVRLGNWITENENFDPLEIFKSFNFDVNFEDEFGSTMLTTMLFRSHVETVEFLLAKGADVNFVGRDDQRALTVVIFSVKNKMYSEEVGLKYVDLLLEYGADTQFHYLTNDGGIRMIFDDATNNISFRILAHLAMIEAVGGKIEDVIFEEIESETTFQNYFDSCKQTINNMKRITMQSGVTLFQIISENRAENIIKLARNKKLVAELESMKHFNRCSKVYYYRKLRKQVAKIIKIANIRKNAFEVVSQIQGLRMNGLVIGEIVDYVIYDDLKAVASGILKSE